MKKSLLLASLLISASTLASYAAVVVKTEGPVYGGVGVHHGLKKMYGRPEVTEVRMAPVERRRAVIINESSQRDKLLRRAGTTRVWVTPAPDKGRIIVAPSPEHGRVIVSPGVRER